MKAPASVNSHKEHGKGWRGGGRIAALSLSLLLLVGLLGLHSHPAVWAGSDGPASVAAPADRQPTSPVLVSYSYFEKDAVQRDNFDFFLTIGMGLDNQAAPSPADTDFVVVVSGEACRPCARLAPLLTEIQPPSLPGLAAEYRDQTGHLTLLKRSENVGMDFAAHNATLTWMTSRRRLRQYRYFIFLNSSVKGPFVPSYMPAGWQWTHAYTDRLQGSVKAVSSSLVCLPEVDSGGYGPKLESWAFGVDQDGLDALLHDGVFHTRIDKLGKDGVVVKGEYGITISLFQRGYNIDTLMAMYRNVDWHDKQHWRCNNNVHPSRHGTYAGVSMNPFETVFLKASWHVGEPFVDRYSAWALAQAAGNHTTAGSFDERMYRYAISPQAQESHNVEHCYDVLGRQDVNGA